MANLRGRLRSWLGRREPEIPGAIPMTPQPPPIPVVELPELEIVEFDEEETEVRAWGEAFIATTGGRPPVGKA